MFSLRRVLPLISLCLLAASCGSAPDLPPGEVIRRAVINSHLLDSVAVSVSASFGTEGSSSLSGSLVAQGVLRNGGQAWSADAAFDTERTGRTGYKHASGRIIASVPGDGRTFLRFESLQGLDIKFPVLSSTGTTSGWWVIGTESKPDAPTVAQTAPDPAVLDSYASALTVTENMGTQRGRDGTLQYHYRVKLDPSFMRSLAGSDTDDATAEGELWISTVDFSLRRVQWVIGGLPTSSGPIGLRVDAAFSDQNRAPLVRRPTGSAATLPLDSIFAIFSL